MTAPTIREAVAADRDWLADCAVAMALETEHKQLDPGTVRAGVATGISDSAKARYFVAIDGDGVRVGTLIDRKRVVWGKSVSVRVDLGGRRIITKKKKKKE